jgi:hypothetical protein
MNRRALGPHRAGQIGLSDGVERIGVERDSQCWRSAGSAAGALHHFEERLAVAFQLRSADT